MYSVCLLSFHRVPCVSIGMCGDVVVAGFSTGHLRLYSMSQASLLVEITAHAQTVMSLDVDVASRKVGSPGSL